MLFWTMVFLISLAPFPDFIPLLLFPFSFRFRHWEEGGRHGTDAEDTAASASESSSECRNLLSEFA